MDISSGNLFPLRRCLAGEDPKETRARELCPLPLSPAGRTGKKAAPHCFPSPSPLERNAMFSCFQLTPPPPQQPSAFLRPGVKTATGESWESWRELHWWLGLGLKGSPQEPGEPPPTPTLGPSYQASVLGADPFHSSWGWEGKTPRSRGKAGEGPRGLWEGSQQGGGWSPGLSL